ncbi:hypothetical protein Cri9333_0402 [Crinalium epipsammum PCC 9333]|uniref:Uncharacterized protein n=1 Tax=Crinalium epipsammum PCC 9333 TaxID=1173022 RepID=K9VTU4_9CYAN|nr:hypothetical protein [Crinalium epipsammum]AFZ11376.1 hypothetical protein Cri9333_0402 [Crinalium epipsammum PCC 9333]
MNDAYIAQQIHLLKKLTAQQGEPNLIENKLWRIGNNAGFPDIGINTKLSEEQKAAVYTFIEEFEVSPSGKVAIDKFNKFNSSPQEVPRCNEVKERVQDQPLEP